MFRPTLRVNIVNLMMASEMASRLFYYKNIRTGYSVFITERNVRYVMEYTGKSERIYKVIKCLCAPDDYDTEVR